MDHITVKEASAMLRSSKATVLRMIKNGKIKAARPARKWLIPSSEITRVLKAH